MKSKNFAKSFEPVHKAGKEQNFTKDSRVVWIQIPLLWDPDQNQNETWDLNQFISDPSH